jgi:hypothetical protein
MECVSSVKKRLNLDIYLGQDNYTDLYIKIKPANCLAGFLLAAGTGISLRMLPLYESLGPIY